MKGREHLIWALMAYSLAIFFYSVVLDFRNLKWIWYLLFIIQLFLSIVFNDYANLINTRNEIQNKNRKKGSPRIKLTDKEKWMIDFCRIMTYILLVLTMTFTGVFSMPMADTSLTLMLGYMTAFFGGAFPDFDSFINIKFHRDPFTHSGILAVSVCVTALLICPYSYISVLIPFIGFLLGVTSHLVADNLKSDATLADALFGLFKEKGAPGDIRKIVENRERHWLGYHYISCLFLAILMLMRIAAAGIMNWKSLPEKTLNSPGGLFLLGFWGLYLILSGIFYLAWKKKKE
ncbi:MAG: hypothetical protein ACFFCS_06795 [Candidatus Hodarchaeota archaeon]